VDWYMSGRPLCVSTNCVHGVVLVLFFCRAAHLKVCAKMQSFLMLHRVLQMVTIEL